MQTWSRFNAITHDSWLTGGSRATRKFVVENRRYQGQAAEGFKPTHPNERGRGPRGQRRQLWRQQLGNLHASTIADFGRLEERRDVILRPFFGDALFLALVGPKHVFRVAVENG